MDDKSLYASIEHELPVFYRSWWLNAVCVSDWQVRFVKDSLGAISAVWPFFIQRKAGLMLLRNPQLTPYLGPYDIRQGRCDEATFQQLEQSLPRTAFRQWTGLPSIRNASVYNNLGFKIITRRTFLLDLKLTEEDLWRGVYAKRRNDIRKGEKDLHVNAGFPDIDLFISLQRAAFESKGKRYPYDASIIRRAMDASSNHHAALPLTAKDEQGVLQACVWLVFDHHTMYYLLSATPPKAHRGAVALLLWHAIRRAKEMGLSVFDFEGSMDPDIALFFQRFGGVEQQYDEVQQTQSLIWKLKQKLLG